MSIPTRSGAAATARDPLRHVKAAVRALKAYTLTPRAAQIKIDQNENPYELPQPLKRQIVDAALARPWGRYPDFDPRELTAALARHSGWQPDGILAGNGSNEMIEALLLVTVGPGVRVVIPEPTFTLYALMTTVLGGEAVRVGLGPEFEYDVDLLLRARREAAATLTIVCTPNNPTGGVLALDGIERLCADSDGLVVIDEAYHEFAGASAVPLLERHPNLVVLRTFSKAMGMAGLRLGYLLAAPELVREVNKGRLPYNVNFFTQAAALAALSQPGTLQSVVARLVRQRDALYARLQTLAGLRVYPSRANFLLIELKERDPKAVFEALYQHGILVRDVTSYPRLSRCLRVSVGTEEENEALLAALSASLA
jgi:histidinol-phosphate aminotransferase